MAAECHGHNDASKHAAGSYSHSSPCFLSTRGWRIAADPILGPSLLAAVAREVGAALKRLASPLSPTDDSPWLPSVSHL